MKNLEGLLALLVNISIAFSPMMAAKIFKDIAQGMTILQINVEIDKRKYIWYWLF